jgi:phospholipid transport system substrate-binding protein
MTANSLLVKAAAEGDALTVAQMGAIKGAVSWRLVGTPGHQGGPKAGSSARLAGEVERRWLADTGGTAVCRPADRCCTLRPRPGWVKGGATAALLAIGARRCVRCGHAGAARRRIQDMVGSRIRYLDRTLKWDIPVNTDALVRRGGGRPSVTMLMTEMFRTPSMTTALLGRRSILAMTVAILVPVAFPRFAIADSVLAPVQQLNDGLLRVMKAGHGTPFAQRFDMLAPVIDQTFDLTTILKESVGTSWQSLPPDQQATLLKAFQRYTIASYINSFDEYNGQRFLVNPETQVVGNDQVVRTQIIPVSGEGHDLNYVMREGPGGWRVADVLADGAVSRVAVQRSDFRRLIRQGGALALAQSLEAKSAHLSD